MDDVFERTSVEPVFLAPLTQGEGGEGAVDDGLDLGTYLTGPNAIIAGLVLITVLLALLVLRRRGGETGKAYTLQEATWGIQEDAFGPIPTAPAPSPPPAAPPSTPSALAAPEALSVDLYAAAQRLAPARMEAPVTRSAAPSPTSTACWTTWVWTTHHLQPKEAWTPPSSTICCDRCAEARHRPP